MGIKSFMKKFFSKIKKRKVVPYFNQPAFTSNIINDSNFEIGRFTYGKPNILSWNEGHKLIIGSFCSIADNVTIFLGGNHRGDWISTYPFMEFPKDFENSSSLEGHPSSKGDVIIGNDVWIGYGVTILSGVTIGDGVIIGANSVISKDVGPYQVVVGNPGKIVKTRFNDSEIDFLLKLKWWEFPKEKIDKISYLLCSDNILELKNMFNDEY